MNRRVGLALLVTVGVLLVIGTIADRQDPMATSLDRALRTPGAAHLLGTDALGRDVLARLLAGTWSSLVVALVAVGTASLLGASTGSVAGLSRGVTDRVLSTGADLLLAFPSYVVLLNLAAVVPLRSSVSLGLLIGVTSWMGLFRIVRTEVQSLGRRLHVEAARASGAASGRIVALHLFPHVGRLVLEMAGLRFASAVLIAATLDYLGIGISVDRPTWGRMIRDGQTYLRDAPWIALPTIALLCVATVGLVLASERRAAGSRGGRPRSVRP